MGDLKQPNNRIKQTNFRVDQDTADAFRKFCEENGWNQAEGFDNVMRQVELNKAKAATPGRAVEIESFEKSIKDIMAAYLNSIEINNKSEDRIREQFASALDRKDKTITELQNKITDLKEGSRSLEREAVAAAKAADQALKEKELAKEQASTAIKLAEDRANTIDSLNNRLAIMEKKAAELDDLKITEAQARYTIEKLQNNIEVLKNEHSKEIDKRKQDAEAVIRDLTKDMERKISDIQKDDAFALEKAVSEKERDMMEQIRTIEKENARLQAKIELLEARVRELTVEEEPSTSKPEEAR